MNYRVEKCEHTNGKSIAATTSAGVVTDPSEEIIGMAFSADTIEEAELLAMESLCFHIAVSGLELDNKWYESVAITMTEVESTTTDFLQETEDRFGQAKKDFQEMTSQETVNASQLPKHEVAMAIHHLVENNGDKEGDDIDILAALSWLREAQEIMTPELQKGKEK